MTAIVEQLRTDLLALSVTDRTELAYLLLESLEEPASETQERAFDKELARRAEEIAFGRVTGIPAEELFARIDARLAAGGQ